MLAVFLVFLRLSSGTYNLSDFIWPPVKYLKSDPFTSFCSLGQETLEQIVSLHSDVVLPRFGLSHPAPALCPFYRCELGHMNPDNFTDSYSLAISGSICQIGCLGPSACLAALTTFVSLLQPFGRDGALFPLTDFEISDHASVGVRGLMLDTGRRFLSKRTISDHLDLMAMAHMNRLHWHISDDQSFPLEIAATQKAFRYSDRSKYTMADLREISHTAQRRGIELVLEIDVPTHVQSLVAGYPEITSDRVKFGLDITSDAAYEKIRAILSELTRNFGLSHFHLGGDETWAAWDTPGMAAWAKDQGLEAGNKKQLIMYYLKRLSAVVGNFKITLWEDFLRELGVFEAVEPEVVEVISRFDWQLWRSNTTVFETLDRLNISYTYSSPFYLDNLSKNWKDFYDTDFHVGKGLSGGEACMWGEWSDNVNSVARVWPRAAAVAARLWEGPRTGDAVNVRALSLWVCRARKLGYNVDPVGNFAADGGDLVDKDWKLQWSCDDYDDGSFFGGKQEVNTEVTLLTA